MNFKMSVREVWSLQTCEYLSENVSVFSLFGYLRIVNKITNNCSYIRVASLIEIVMSVIPLMARLFRLQFYNTIPFSKGMFVCYGKKIFWIDGFKNKHLVLKGNKFRVFRNSCCVKGDSIFFGEYFSNPHRDIVNVYRFDCLDKTLSVIKTFKEGEVRHVHSIRDAGKDHILVLTGDIESECRILKFNLKTGEEVILGQGSEHFRAIYGVMLNSNRLIYATDAEYMENTVVQLKDGIPENLFSIRGPVFYGIKVRSSILLSVVMEGAACQVGNEAELMFYNYETKELVQLLALEKDRWSKKYFQFGQILLPYVEGEVDVIWVKGMSVKSWFFKAYEITL